MEVARIQMLTFYRKKGWPRRYRVRYLPTLPTRRGTAQTDYAPEMPVPWVIWIPRSMAKIQTKVAFMLMEFLPENVAMDADGGLDTHHGQIVQQHRVKFYDAAAHVQVSPLL